MTETTTLATVTGSAAVQGDLWSVRAADYAAVQEPLFMPLYEAILRRPEVAQARALLDIGCGPGLAAQTMATTIDHVAGIDASAVFVAMARERLPQGEFVVGEMESLPFADGTFDVVTGFNAFQYATSPVRALREARRVVKPAGLIVVAVWGPPASCDAAGHLKALGPLMPPAPPGAPGPFALSQESALNALATEAGLTPLNIVDAACPWTYPDLETALRGMLSAGPAERAIRASGAAKVRTAVADAIAPYRTSSDTYHLSNTFRCLLACA